MKVSAYWIIHKQNTNVKHGRDTKKNPIKHEDISEQTYLTLLCPSSLVYTVVSYGDSRKAQLSTNRDKIYSFFITITYINETATQYILCCIKINDCLADENTFDCQVISCRLLI